MHKFTFDYMDTCMCAHRESHTNTQTQRTRLSHTTSDSPELHGL